MTSAVTGHPLDLAQRMISADPAVETWQTCSAEPTCAASRQSRAMMASSATAGQPARPRRADISPSLSCAPSVSLGSWACWAITPSKALTYSRARRISSGSDTHRPSSENTRTRAAESAIVPSSASLAPAEPDRDGAHRLDVAVARGAAEPPDLLDHPGRVGHRVGVGHRVHRGVAAEGRRRGPCLHRFRVFAAGLAQVRVQVDEAGQGDQAAGVEGSGAGVIQAGPDGRDGPAVEQDAGGLLVTCRGS